VEGAVPVVERRGDQFLAAVDEDGRVTRSLRELTMDPEQVVNENRTR